ncbi:putative phage tail assembly chaperone [Oceanobacter mangrovi]|uniref:putative phage tail assembly chaperone n=1 Tax=Oceanobacter mangrovi TaxID=2862510 RepID=UPI001C8ECF78|nr:putative phage tail assembly chaperone [Oceanobacter mangrovi]
MAATATTGKKDITLTVAETDLRFSVGLTEFNAFQNEFLPTNKVAPSHNFLVRSIHPDDKETLTAWLDQGLAFELANAVAEQFKLNTSEINHH